MHEQILWGLTAVLALSAGAQWIAWKLKLPSILLLLTFGILAGPVLGWVDPDQMFGDMLQPLVSIGVALILFEGGLTLKIQELRKVGGAVAMLCTVAVAIAWGLGALAAHWTLGMDWGMSLLLGAILVVTGPTVIIPLLRQVRPARKVSSILKWEGIVNDPTGAILAVLVFEAISAGLEQQAVTFIAQKLAFAAVVGVGVGLAGAAVMVVGIRRHWIPNAIESGVVLASVVLCFTISNHFAHESGLLAVTVMGIAMANQPFARVSEIARFKESLGTLIVGILFILLASRLGPRDFQALDWRVAVFVALMIAVVRPVTIFASTIGTSLTLAQRAFIACMAPRGIIAAAVASVFALRLAESGVENAERIATVVFAMIVGTIVVYGLGAQPLAKALGVGQKGVGTILIAGSDPLARAVASVLAKRSFDVRVVDSDRSNVRIASMTGLNARHGNILSPRTDEWLESAEVGVFLSMFPDDEANALATDRFAHELGRTNAYQLAASGKRRSESSPEHIRGRILFGKEWTHEKLIGMLEQDWTIKVTPLTEEFTYTTFRERNPDSVFLFVLDEKVGWMKPITHVAPVTPAPGQLLVSLVPPRKGESGMAGHESPPAV